MKNKKNYLYSFILLLITTINSAFIIVLKDKQLSKSSINLPINSTNIPPQYKPQKLAFFENIMLNKLIGKSKRGTITDIDKTVKSAYKLGSLSNLCLMGVFLAADLYGYGIFIGLGILGLGLLFSILCLYKAFSVLNNPNASDAQKKVAKRAEKRGGWGLVLGIVFFVVVAALVGYALEL